MGVTNAVTIDADAVHELTLVGPGAGGKATASAIVADIADIARGVRSAPFGWPVAALIAGAAGAGADARRRLLYPAFAVRPAGRGGGDRDAHGRARDFAGKHRAAPPPRRQSWAGGAVPVVLITHATHEQSVRQALEAAVADGFLAEKPQVIRIERE